jgi:hypothetical protein
MLAFLRRKAGALARTAEVGWIIDADKAGFIWAAPQKLSRHEVPGRHAKSVRFCPAMLDHEARLVEVTCPIDLHLRIGKNEQTGAPVLVNVAGDRSTIRSRHLNEMVALVAPKEWRQPARPILQVITPYLFLADEPVYLNQMPPFAHYVTPPWPGTLIGGRFPINIWPRHLMWAFEWADPKQDLILRRGEPWFYLKFETQDPSRPIRLVEAEMTAELREYLKGLSSVTNYVNRTFSLFSVARDRRPKTLLVPKRAS